MSNQEQPKEEIVVRDLTRADRVKLTGLMLKAMLKMEDDSFKKIISSDKKSISKKGPEKSDEDWAQTILDIMTAFLTKSMAFIDEDLSEWLASLIGKSIKEFDEMPFDIELTVLEQIRAKPEAAKVFMRAWALANMTNVSENLLKNLKTKYGSIFSFLGDSTPLDTEK